MRSIIAKLARRVNSPELAIRILHPIVRPTNRSQPKATGTEISEYAAALTYIGASTEAYGLLGKVDAQANPEVLLYQAFALFAQWNYKAAIDPLVQYINRKDISDYDRLVGKANLASALVIERVHKDAEEVLTSIIGQAREGGNLLLLGNAYEMLAENNILLGRWNTAEKLLYEAEAAMKDPSSL